MRVALGHDAVVYQNVKDNMPRLHEQLSKPVTVIMVGMRKSRCDVDNRMVCMRLVLLHLSAAVILKVAGVLVTAAMCWDPACLPLRSHW